MTHFLIWYVCIYFKDTSLSSGPKCFSFGSGHQWSLTKYLSPSHSPTSTLEVNSAVKLSKDKRTCEQRVGSWIHPSRWGWRVTFECSSTWAEWVDWPSLGPSIVEAPACHPLGNSPKKNTRIKVQERQGSSPLWAPYATSFEYMPSEGISCSQQIHWHCWTLPLSYCPSFLNMPPAAWLP